MAELNKFDILKMIDVEGGITIAEISRRTGMTKNKIQSMFTRFADRKCVDFVKKVENGKRLNSYYLNCPYELAVIAMQNKQHKSKIEKVKLLYEFLNENAGKVFTREQLRDELGLSLDTIENYAKEFADEYGITRNTDGKKYTYTISERKDVDGVKKEYEHSHLHRIIDVALRPTL